MTITIETAADADDADSAGSSGSMGSDPDLPPEPPGVNADPHPPISIPASIPADVDVIVSETARGPAVARVDRDRLSRRLQAAITVLDRPLARVGVLIVDDAVMASMHERHTGIAGPTDVLTFSGSAPGEPIDADIAVNADEAERESARRAHDADDELLLYALHGVLHCAGFDDHTDDDFEAMHAEEDRILTAIGVGVTFGARRATEHDR